MVVHLVDEARDLVAQDLDGDRVQGSLHPPQHEIAPRVDLRAPARRDHGGRVELLDDGGP